MMGPRQEAQAALFYEFSLEDHELRITYCARLTGLSI